MIRRVAFALLLGLLAGPAGAQQKTEPSVVQHGTARTEEFVRAFVAAMAAHDPDRVAALFAETAIVATPEGPVVSGRARIRALYAQVLAAREVALTFVQAQSDGDQANAVLLWTWNLEVAQPGREVVRRQVRSMLHLKGGPGGWLVAADLYQVVPAP